MPPLSTYDLIYAIVKHIPRSQVTTYGQIATLANLGRHARQVGYALSTNTRIPWHRVINAKGEISPRKDPKCEHRQRRLLEQEGVLFDELSRVALSQFGWKLRRAPQRS